MALNIRSAEAEKLAAQLAKLTGETKTEAVTNALRSRLERVQRKMAGHSRFDTLSDLAKSVATLPDLDSRSADAIIGYDEHGLPL
jgi:antitoxin VapB